MRTIAYSIALLFSFVGIFSSCDDTKTYAELLEEEKTAIRKAVSTLGINPTFVSDEQLDLYLDGTSTFNKDEWYKFENGLYMKINDFGSEVQKYKDMNNPIIVVRYDSCYNLLQFENLSSDFSNNLENYQYSMMNPWRWYRDPNYSGAFGYAIEFAPNFLGEKSNVSLIIPSKLNNSEIQQAVVPFYYKSLNYLPNYQ